MLLNAISPSNIFTQFSDPSSLQKPDFISLFPIRISTKGNKNSSKRTSTVKCTQQKEAEAVSRDKKLALAEWLSKDPSEAAASDPSSNPAGAKFKSVGTPSRPSKSRHSYNPFTPPSSPQSRGGEPPKSYGKKPWNRREPSTWTPKKLDLNTNGAAPSEDDSREVVFGENGLAYRLPKAPFEFQYSYTETPKVKPLALREAAFVPFGPTTMPRPWTGRAPLPPSKKKVPEFDSFKLPPPNKKGVKHIQPPGPFRPGEGPKYVKTREEILGEPLTREEVKQLVESSCHSSRQLNMGRDGFTHNMLENIHAHWKRRRVCKIKCKGVATVDMDNICKQLEEKTGGKVIHRAGGAIYLYRGRNYNYKMRPVFPMMLWKPAAAVYPRLIERAPGGLTMEEAKELRQRGRLLPPICKLAKNGVYLNLVQDVRDAFKVSDLVRVNCQGLKPSDYRKIGAKLKDLVPCVLLSFEYEHILMWRGKNCNAEEQGAEAPEAHSDREGSIAESVSDSDRSTVMTSVPFDEQLSCEYLASDPSLTKENVLESSPTPSKFFGDEALGDKNGMTVNFEKSTEVEVLTKISDDKDKGEVDFLKDKLGTMSFSEVEPEQLTESSEMEIFSDGELNMGVSTSAIHADTGFLGEDFTCNSQSSSSSKVEVELIESSKMEVSPDGDLNFSVSAMDTNAHCLGEDSTHNLQNSSSNVELDELIESSKMELLSDGECDLSSSVSATNIIVRWLDEDSTHNSQTLDTLIPKQISEDYDALPKSVDADSYNLVVLTADSSNKLTESFSTAAEASTVSEELVASSDEESNLYSDEESKLYSDLEYAEEKKEQENNGTYDDDVNEFIEDNTVETSQEEGVGLNIEVLWEQAIESGRAMVLYESELEPDSVREKAIAFAKNAPAGPFFKRRFSRKKVGKPWKRNSNVKTKESEGQNPSQINSNNGKEKLLLSSNDLPRGGLPVDELARLLAQ